jgi:hypothetical protein
MCSRMEWNTRTISSVVQYCSSSSSSSSSLSLLQFQSIHGSTDLATYSKERLDHDLLHHPQQQV